MSHFLWIFIFLDLNLHRGKQQQATGLVKVKHKCYFIYALTNSHPPTPLGLLCLPSLGSQAALPQKVDMPRQREAEAVGGDGQLGGYPDRAGTEHMQQFSSDAPTQTFPNTCSTLGDNRGW